jgi:hypothetical protein
MKSRIIGLGIVVALGIYFVLGIYVLPELYLTRPQAEPHAKLMVLLSDSEISVGSTFEVDMAAENIGDLADILVLSIAFPNLGEIDDSIKIVSYDFTQSPINIEIGQEIGTKYLATQKTVPAKYPSIEAYSRPATPDVSYHMKLSITPKQVGDFIFYTKSVTLPHLSSQSHFPQDGEIDHSGEYVEVYSVKVNP